MKRKFLLITILLVLVLLPLTAKAAGISANMDNESCAKGSTVTLSVSLSESIDVASGAIEVMYDKTKLQLVEGVWNVPGSLITNFDIAKEKGAFAFSSTSTVGGNIFYLTFKVLSGASLGDTEVKCTIQLRDAANNNVFVDDVKAQIIVTCEHNFSSKTNNYLAENATCTSAATYYYSCSICGIKGETTYTVGEPKEHKYNRMVTSAEYLVTNVKCVDSAEYYYSCACGARGFEKFKGDASWTHNYNNAWYIDEYGHWNACVDCGAKKNYATHDATNNVCNTCFFVIESEGEHIHNFSIMLKTDEVGHWYECYCGEKKDYAPHNYGNATTIKQPTESEKGEEIVVCEICYHATIREVPMIIVNNSEEPKSNIALVVIVTICCVLGVEAIIYILYKNFKKKPVEIVERSNPIEAIIEPEVQENTEVVEENNEKINN